MDNSNLMSSIDDKRNVLKILDENSNFQNISLASSQPKQQKKDIVPFPPTESIDSSLSESTGTEESSSSSSDSECSQMVKQIKKRKMKSSSKKKEEKTKESKI